MYYQLQEEKEVRSGEMLLRIGTRRSASLRHFLIGRQFDEMNFGAND